jgi:hypothetical protein
VYLNRLLPVVMVAVILGFPLPGCRAADEPENPRSEAAKIRFPLDDIRPDGLRGPPDGLASVAYEFCVPADDGVYRELLQIDPGLQIQPASSGRVGCLASQSLVIGETGQAGWRDKLEALTRLDYVKEIRECHFE